MAGPEEMVDVAAGVKRPTTASSMDLDSLQRKKFKTDELPLSAAQHSAIEHLLHAFKKRGGFDSIRKKIWSEFHDGEGKIEFTKLLIELAESEIDREPGLLSRERGKAATLIEGAVDRSDVYKTVEHTLDALAEKHLPAILDSVRDIRRDEVGEEIAAQEETAGNKTDEDYAAHVKAKRDEREKAWQEELRKQKEIEEEEARKKAEEDRKRRELERQKEEEERARRREREEQRREEQRKLDEQREKERQERYERRRREERDRYRDWRDRSRTRDRDSDRDRDRDRYRYRDRSPGYRSDRAHSPRYRDSRKEKSPTPKEPTPAAAPAAPPVDEKSLEEAALQLLLKEGEELAAKARQKPEFDFEEAEAIENGLKPPPKGPKADSRFSNTPTKAGSPAGEADPNRRRGSTADDRPRTKRRDESRSRSRRRFSSRFDDDRPERSRDVSSQPRNRDSDDRLVLRDFRDNRYETEIVTVTVTATMTTAATAAVTETEIAGTGTETGIEIGIETATDLETVTAIETTTAAAAATTPGPAHDLDTVPAHAPAPSTVTVTETAITTATATETSAIETEIETETPAPATQPNGIEIEAETATATETETKPTPPPKTGDALPHPPAAYPYPHDDDPARADDRAVDAARRVSSTSIAMCRLLVVGAGLLVGGCDRLNERRKMSGIDRALLRLIGIFLVLLLLLLLLVVVNG
ncbi:hypothetical protein ABHI18_004823 [Aspergillus niger]